MRNPRTDGGFTLLEIILVVAIIGSLMVWMIPSIMNSLETRNLDNSARQIQTTLQLARFRAINEKVDYRVRFAQVAGVWQVLLEVAGTSGTWTPATDFLMFEVSTKVILTLSLPSSQAVEFSSVGLVQGYDSNHNSLTLQSLKLKGYHQQDLRILTVFQGGSVRYQRSSS
jgi:prepilin-type N-terminal cleavage/methylation domain-containing protein